MTKRRFRGFLYGALAVAALVGVSFVLRSSGDRDADATDGKPDDAAGASVSSSRRTFTRDDYLLDPELEPKVPAGRITSKPRRKPMSFEELLDYYDTMWNSPQVPPAFRVAKVKSIWKAVRKRGDSVIPDIRAAWDTSDPIADRSRMEILITLAMLTPSARAQALAADMISDINQWGREGGLQQNIVNLVRLIGRGPADTGRPLLWEIATREQYGTREALRVLASTTQAPAETLEKMELFVANRPTYRGAGIRAIGLMRNERSVEAIGRLSAAHMQDPGVVRSILAAYQETRRPGGAKALQTLYAQSDDTEFKKQVVTELGAMIMPAPPRTPDNLPGRRAAMKTLGQIAQNGTPEQKQAVMDVLQRSTAGNELAVEVYALIRKIKASLNSE